jgi:hypothetical protein
LNLETTGSGSINLILWGVTKNLGETKLVSTTKKIVYFDLPGPQNTDETYKAAKERAKELGIKDIVIASSSGETGVKASEFFKGFNLVIVSHAAGFRGTGTQEMPEEARKKITANGAKVLTTGHALSGIERGIKAVIPGVMPLELVAQTLRMFGQGTKVAVEITVMAADAGLIPGDRDIITISGTGKGSDTAYVIKPANSNNFFDLFVKEVIGKPLCAKAG